MTITNAEVHKEKKQEQKSTNMGAQKETIYPNLKKENCCQDSLPFLAIKMSENFKCDCFKEKKTFTAYFGDVGGLVFFCFFPP